MTDCSTQLSVVVHVPDNARLEAIARNVLNLRVALGSQATIEVVTHGPGLDLLLPSAGTALETALESLQAGGVRLVGCRNTLDSRGLGDAALPPDATVVPSGVAHLVHRQRDGYTYLRP